MIELCPPLTHAPRLRTVTREQVISWRPCWVRVAPERLEGLLALAPECATARDALAICRAEEVSPEDTLWLLLRPDWWEEPDFTLRVLACRFAAAVLDAASDPRSLEVVRVAWRHAHGDAAREELREARDAARDAARAAASATARDAARDAARAAAWDAARVAARATAWDAARDAARAAARDAVRDAVRDAAWDAASAAAWADQVQVIADMLDLAEGA